MPKQPDITKLLQKKNHHKRKAIMHYRRFVHHTSSALLAHIRLNALAEARRAAKTQGLNEIAAP